MLQFAMKTLCTNETIIERYLLNYWKLNSFFVTTNSISKFRNVFFWQVFLFEISREIYKKLFKDHFPVVLFLYTFIYVCVCEMFTKIKCLVSSFIQLIHLKYLCFRKFYFFVSFFGAKLFYRSPREHNMSKNKTFWLKWNFKIKKYIMSNDFVFLRVW